jgi:PAS domain S-box-containing protein
MSETKGTNEGNLILDEPSGVSREAEVPHAPYWLDALIESADDAIISKTLTGIVTSWNRAAQRIFGYTADEIVGKPITTIIPEELQDEEATILSKIRSGEPIEHFETVRLRKDGTRVDISLSISPIKTPDGRVIGASKIARNITDQKRAEHERRLLLQAAEEARHEAEAANKAKDNFLALLSHELRTPLHSMQGWLSMLSNGLLNEDQKRKALGVIMRGIDSQRALIDDLVDVSRIVSGKMSILTDRISLVAVVTNAIEQMRPIAGENNIRLLTDLDTDADDLIGDEARLRQVVTNLINNAVKYTPPGGEIIVELKRLNGEARIVVRDSGIGIAPEHLSRIFERFEQGDSSSRRNYGGLGLGLAIARHLTELHGGTITAESEGEGSGSTFTVSLPLNSHMSKQSIPSQSQTVRADTDATLLVQKRILIVEDDADSLEMLRLVLENYGAVVIPVDRSHKAVEELGRSKFDLMISDLGLPEMDGFDLISEVRNGLGLVPSMLPAIALSGYVAEDDRHRSLSSGFQLHLQKPLDISTIALTIKSLLEISDEDVLSERNLD